MNKLKHMTKANKPGIVTKIYVMLGLYIFTVYN